MKTLLFAFVFTSGLWAQLTTVTDTLKDAQGKPISGQVQIEWGEFTTAAGVHVGAGRSFVPIEKGAFTTALQPTDTATPAGQTYTVTYSVSNYTRNPEKWRICTSASPISIANAVAGTCGGAGPGTLSWAAVTSTTWAAITSTTWATLTN
jgi:hypothetical protein